MRKQLFLLMAIASAVVTTTSAPAQVSTSDPPRRFVNVGYGVFGVSGAAFHTPDFKQLDGVPSCCPVTYPEGTSFAFGIGILYRRDLTRTLVGELRLGYFGSAITFERVEDPILAAGPVDPLTKLPRPTHAVFAHTMETTLGTASLEALVGYRLIDGLRLYAGINVSVLAVKDIHYREQIVYPLDIIFTDSRLKKRYEYQGDIPNPSALLFDVSIGLGYSLKLDRREHLFLEPQVFYSPGLISLIQQNSGTWRVGFLRAGAALRYATLGIPLPPPPLADYELPPLHVE